MKKTIQILLAISISVGFVPSMMAEGAPTTVLGGSGEIYTLSSGRYGDLFPGGQEASAESEVLALGIQMVGQPAERLLVPGTAGPEREEWASLVSDPFSGKLFLVWEMQLNSIHPLLNLVAFDNGSWSEIVEIVHNPFSPKTSPRLLVTHDELSIAGTDEAPLQRLLVHLVWTEQQSEGLYEGFYTALTVDAGELKGHSQIFRLDDLLGEVATEVGGAQELPPSLAATVEIHHGRDDHTALILFYSSRARALVTLELDVLPPQVVRLADEARAQIIDVGATLGGGPVHELGNAARQIVLSAADAFHPEIARALAEEARAQIIDVGARVPRPDVRSIADHARAQIIDVGAKLAGRGLRNVHANAVGAPVLQLDLTPESEGTTAGDQIARLRRVAMRPTPAIASSERLFIRSSLDGTELVLAWRIGDHLHYVESSDAAWSESKSLTLVPDTFDWEKATALLADRVRNR